MSAVSTVLFGIDDRVCRIRLNRPEKLNALNEVVWGELHRRLSELQDRPDVSLVVISGEGRSFSAGADLSSFGGAEESEQASWAVRRHGMGRWQRLLDLLESVPQVTVAGIHGHCVGGAALLAVACDIRLAAPDCLIRIPELAIGIPLTWAGVPRLAREVGLPMARDLVMTGREIGPREALSCGFVQRVVEDLEAGLAGVVSELLAMPPGALAMTRSVFAAISRAEVGSTGWADADVLSWSLREPESRSAAEEYGRRGLGTRRPGTQER
jgi:enoyl-CoA hydratase/carnithine racemase